MVRQSSVIFCNSVCSHKCSLGSQPNQYFIPMRLPQVLKPSARPPVCIVGGCEGRAYWPIRKVNIKSAHPPYNLILLAGMNQPSFRGHVWVRVAKCHGYGGYIRVKKLEGWVKKSGRIHSFAKSSTVLGKFEQLIWNSVFKPGLYDRMFSFCSPEVAFGNNFIPSGY